MSLPDKHDRRRFRHVAVLAADGTVLATTEVAEGSPLPPDTDARFHIEITPLYPYDLAGVTVAKATIDGRDKTAILEALRTANKVGVKRGG